jgi:hypothetical protein
MRCEGELAVELKPADVELNALKSSLVEEGPYPRDCKEQDLSRLRINERDRHAAYYSAHPARVGSEDVSASLRLVDFCGR